MGVISVKRPLSIDGTEIIGGNNSTHTVNISHDLVAKDAKFESIDCDADKLPWQRG